VFWDKSTFSNVDLRQVSLLIFWMIFIFFEWISWTQSVCPQKRAYTTLFEIVMG